MKQSLANTGIVLLTWPLLALWLLLAGLIGTIIVSPLLLILTLAATGLLSTLPWSLGVIMNNYFHVLGYLTLPWIDIFQLPDFPSSASARFHFMEVKQLFLLAFIVFIVLSLVLFIMQRRLRRHGRLLITVPAVRWLPLLPLAVAVLLVTVDFNTLFTGFHQLLFNNDAWLFDPATDPVILILPESFFAVCAVAILVLYEGFYYGVVRRWWHVNG